MRGKPLLLGVTMSDSLSIFDMMFLKGDITLYEWVMYSIVYPLIAILLIVGIIWLYYYLSDKLYYYKHRSKRK